MARLYVLGGPDVGRTHELAPGDVVGRAPDCALTLRHASVSRRHARFEREEGVGDDGGERWRVVDAGSRNGVVVDGARVERAELADGAVFKLGEVELRFRLAPEAPETPPERGAPAPRAAPVPASDPDEIELEMPDEPLAGATTFVPRGAASPASVPARPGPPPTPRTRPSGPAPPPAVPPPRAPLPEHRIPAARGGLFSSDLAQQPPLVRLFAALLVVGLFGALAYGAWRATLLLRSRVASPPPIEEPEDG